MTSTMLVGVNTPSIPTYDPALKGVRPWESAIFGVVRLPTDPIGTTTVTFSGVNAGSEIRVYLPDGTEAAGIESCAPNQVLTWSVYASGSANNTVRVVVVNVAYKIKEFNYAVTIGNQSLPIQQEADKWYSNPV